MVVELKRRDQVKDGENNMLRHCPVTSGLPLKCTELGFAESCEKFRENLSLQKGKRSDYCNECQGNVPGEVIFVSVDKGKIGILKAEGEGDQKICFLCGERKSLKNQYGVEVCSYCMITRIQAKNRPDTLIKALQEFKQLPEGDTSGESADLQDEIDRLRTDLSVAKSALLGGVGKESVTAVKAELLGVKRKLAAARVQIRQFEEIERNGFDPTRFHELAWKFAEGVMSGEVVGVDVEDIRLLRGVQ